ncbi:MAG: hypothetical protein QXP66_02020 [Candidatus Aenigmatarchaeota archaeon]
MGVLETYDPEALNSLHTIKKSLYIDKVIRMGKILFIENFRIW